MILLAAMVAVSLVNGDFESGNGSDIPGWKLSNDGRKIWRVEAGAGVNGNRGLVWECAHTNIYAFPTQRIQVKPGRRYRIVAQVKTAMRKIGSGSYGAGVFLEWFDKDGKGLGSCYLPRVRGTNDWVTIENVTKEPIGGDVAYAVVGAFVHRGCVGCAAFDDIEVSEYDVKPIGGLFSSAYRDTAKDGRVTFFAPLFVETNGFRSADWKAEFRYVAADGAKRTVAAEVASPEFVSLSVDVAGLAMGEQRVECDVASVDGGVKDAAGLKFTRVAELPQRKVHVDSRRRLVVDGKPFFPLGLFSSVLRPPVVSAYSKGPFNCVMPYHAPNLKQLDDCEAHGIKVIYALNKVYAGWRSAPKGVKTEEDERRWIEGRMAFAKNHPAMLAWYLADELAVSYVPRLAKRREWLAEVDPDHPTFACYCRFDQMREFLPTVDIFGTDVYPVPDKPLRKAADITRVTDGGLFCARALWQVPQTFSWGETSTTRAAGARFPTRAEMRSMCWQMVAAGANGLIGYCLHSCMDRFTGESIGTRWDDVCAVFSDLKRFSPVFLSGGEPPQVRGVPPSLAARTFREGGEAWLLVCNLEDAATSATFAIDGVRGESAVAYGAGARATDGKVEVSMAPFDVCLIHFNQ